MFIFSALVKRGSFLAAKVGQYLITAKFPHVFLRALGIIDNNRGGSPCCGCLP